MGFTQHECVTACLPCLGSSQALTVVALAFTVAALGTYFVTYLDILDVGFQDRSCVRSYSPVMDWTGNLEEYVDFSLACRRLAT